MTQTFGIIGGAVFFLKILLHSYLMSKIKKNFLGQATLPNSIERLQLFFHFFADAPKNYKWLKTVINILYAIAILCIAIFLIGGMFK